MSSRSQSSPGLSNDEELLSRLQLAYPLLDSALLAAMVSDISGAEKRPEAIDDLLQMLETLTLGAKADNELESSTVDDSPSSRLSDATSTRRGETETSVTSSFLPSPPTDGPITFLLMAFPHYPRDILEEVLEAEEEKHAGDESALDMGLVVQELLSREFVKELEERGLGEYQAQSPVDPGEKERDWTTIASKKKGKKKTKKERDRTLEPRTFILGDVQQRQLRPPTRSLTVGSISLQASVDPWTHLSSLGLRLSELLPSLPAAHFLSLFHRPEPSSPGAALRKELRKIAASHSDAVSPALIRTMNDIVGHPARFPDAEMCLKATKGDIDAALQLTTLLEDLEAMDPTVFHSTARECPATPISPLSRLPEAPYHARHSSASSSIDPIPPSNPGPSSSSGSEWTKVTHKPRRKPKVFNADPLGAYIPAYQNMPAGWRSQTGRASDEPDLSDEELTEDQCRHWATYYQTRRDQALRDASKYWKKGSIGNRGGDVAFVYAEDSRDHDRRSKMWALKAARLMVEGRKKSTKTRDTVDLHGLTVSEALTLSREAVKMWWESAGGEHTPPRSLTIITGRGNHSKGGMSVIGPAVYNALEEDGWRVAKRPGAIMVTTWNRRGPPPLSPMQ